jgi:peptidoglycan hydrolase-like protein with peptidoglycan-binding domain
MLAKMYAEGLGLLQDYVQAHKWWNLAAAQGDADAARARDEIARRMTPAQIAQAQDLARAWRPIADGGPAPAPPAPASTPSAAAASGLSREEVAEVQRRLAERGYAPGPVDGLMGARTAAAIRGYERDAGLTRRGEPTRALLASLRTRAGSTAERGDSPPAPEPAGAPPAEPALVRSATELRREPSSDAAVVRTLAPGTPVAIVERRGAWWRARLSAAGDVGWLRFTEVRLLPREAAGAIAGPGPAAAETADPREDDTGGGGLAGIARNLTGLLGIGRPPARVQGEMTTMGTRGLTNTDLATAHPAP